MAHVTGLCRRSAAGRDLATIIPTTYHLLPDVRLERIAMMTNGIPVWPRAEQAIPSAAGGATPNPPAGRLKLALVSFLFNWPSTGGGIIHTVELATFLKQAGYDVQLFYPRFPAWGLGHVDETCPFPGTAIAFDESSWNAARIGARVRQAVDAFGPDAVLITDCWNFKPHLADALSHYPYFLRMQALECLCPLNNLRLLVDRSGQVAQCPKHQLGHPEDCGACLRQRAALSGGLHRAERALAGVGTSAYRTLLARAVRDAEAVLVLNPEIAELYRPHARRVAVVTWGMDARRFPPPQVIPPRPADDGRVRLLFAGLTDEWIKGWHVLRAAAAQLWSCRRDFEVIVTGDPPAAPEPFARSIGWQSQTALPKWYAQTDIVCVPTIAQDGLSRTSVEAMATGRPVLASRLGGLPFTVRDGETGLLCRAGDVGDWTAKMARLLDDRSLRERLGRQGRAEFQRRFPWETVIAEQYRPLLAPFERRREVN